MASLGAPGPVLDQYYHSLQRTATTLLDKAYQNRPRTRLAKTIFVTFTICVFLLLFSWQSSPVDYWTEYPSYQISATHPEDTVILPATSQSPLSQHVTPSNLQKNTPSFHLLLPAKKRSAALCRTVTSAMILSYPPPTLVGYGKELPRGTMEYDEMVAKVTAILEHLNQNRDVKDEDFVLVLDGLDFFFQLPPDVLIRRFQNLLRKKNLELRKKYGVATVENKSSPGKFEAVQKYTQRVLFGASKECFPNMASDPGCVTVPQSSLPPDVHGWKTDVDEVSLNRPRWLTPSTVMGQVADLKLIYTEILQFVKQRRNRDGDYLALTQMYGRQEYVRELERMRTSSGIKEWLYTRIGISDASNITGATIPHLESGRRYEFGIGVDYESDIFFGASNAADDVEWFRYSNISRSATAQMMHGVPRERRLLLPTDLDNIPNPFDHHRINKTEIVTLPYNESLDALPAYYKQNSWQNIMLMTNVRSASVPALLHVESGSRSQKDSWWEKMWYHPYARALLRKYIRSPSGFDTAQAALRGGQEWWDMRGGRGGLWTDKGEWLGYSEVCGGFERDVFDDERGTFGNENGEHSDEPVYNQFGNLIKGHE